jgi:hypothetical protein
LAFDSSDPHVADYAQDPGDGSDHLDAVLRAKLLRDLIGYLAAYSSRIDHKVCLRFMAWLEQVQQAGLACRR